MHHETTQINPCSQYRGDALGDVYPQVDDLLTFRAKQGSTPAILVITMICCIIERAANLKGRSRDAAKVLH